MITLTVLTENYKKNINNLLDLLRNKVAVFDFDGTLTALQYTPDRILPCKDAELHEYSKKYNIYHNARTLDTMKYIISNLNNENVYILTNTVDTLIDKKNSCIKCNFPYIAYDHIIHTKSGEEKIQKLRELHTKHHMKIVFVEDTLSNLYLAEENLWYVQGYHISNLLA